MLLALVLAAPAIPATPRGEIVECRPAEERRPEPTEVVVGGEADEEHDFEGREEWVERMHRHAPGVDWRAIERANGERLMEERALKIRRKDYTADTWTERGSANQAGRMRCIALSLDGTTIYGGSDRGGVWRAAPDGTGWTPIADSLWGGANQVAVTSTASGQAVLALADWGRLRYTLDEGVNWLTPTGFPAGADVGRRLLTDPSNRAIAYAVVRSGGSQWEILATTDGGLSWSSIRTLSAVGDAWIDRVAGGRLWVLDGGDLVSTANLGGNWRLEGSLPSGSLQDCALAGSEAGSPTFYAVMVRRDGTIELHRSDNAGRTWARQPNPPEFWSQVEASIGDPMIVVLGGVDVHRSTNGGATFTPINEWYQYYGNPSRELHADLFGLDVVMLAGRETWFICTDGGPYASDDAGFTVRNLGLRGLRVGQYYSTLTSRRDPALVLAGAQDQGYQRAFTPGSPTADFDQLISGDYGHLTSPDGTHELVLSTYPGFILVHDGEAAPALSQLDFPAGSQHDWLPSVVADPTFALGAFYFPADRLWRYERDAAGTWRSFQETTQDFSDGGTTWLTQLSLSPVDPTKRIAAADSGRLWYSDDSGLSWTESPDRGPGAHYFYGTALEHSPDDALVAMVAGAGYSGPAAYRTVDGGRTWTPVGNGLPATLVYDIAWAGPGSQVVFAATEAGPYALDPATDTWSSIGGTVAPLTTFWSVETIPAIGVARFGTYGRGLWDWQHAVVAEAGHCADGIDNEGDGAIDCDDSDCRGDADCTERCANGIDDDRDGDLDCADADCLGVDGDGDGRRDCDGTDCAPMDAATWAVPGEVALLRVAEAGGGTARLSWSLEQVAASGPATVHDVVVGNLDILRTGGWPAPTFCMRNDSATSSYDDPTLGLGAIWYLVRAQTSCGAGPWGTGGGAGPAHPQPGCP